MAMDPECLICISYALGMHCLLLTWHPRPQEVSRALLCVTLLYLSTRTSSSGVKEDTNVAFLLDNFSEAIIQAIYIEGVWC